MKRRIYIGCMLLFITINANTQSMKEYTDRLLFNAYTGNPDASIAGFLKLHVPALTKQTVPGTWIKYTAADTIQSQDEIHSFVFKKHPFLITEKIAAGQLDFYCRRYGSSNAKQNITGVQLRLSFDTEREAEIVFSKLVDLFLPISTNKKIGTANYALKAAFIDSKDKSAYGRVRMAMIGDATSAHPYKVVFEIGNDLVN